MMQDSAALPLSTVLRRDWLSTHLLIIPTLFALTAVAAQGLGLDERIASALFDPISVQFPAHAWVLLDALGHRAAKSALIVGWVLLLLLAFASHWDTRVDRMRPVLWATVTAMAIGPTLVVSLKSINSIHCPWDLKEFGGAAYATHDWFVATSESGRCFPGGHAAGGFSLVALYFAGAAAEHKALQRWGLVSALGVGSTFSVIRIVQGAHFLSHNLWAAAIDWGSAAAVFALFAAAQSKRGSSS